MSVWNLWPTDQMNKHEREFTERWELHKIIVNKQDRIAAIGLCEPLVKLGVVSGMWCYAIGTRMHEVPGVGPKK